jgi:hypothetical protein
MRLALATLLFMLSLPLLASDTARINGTIVTTGMSAAEVRKRVGEPPHSEEIQNKFGAVIGHRWEYMDGRRTINLYLQQGKLVRIEEL